MNITYIIIIEIIKHEATSKDIILYLARAHGDYKY